MSKRVLIFDIPDEQEEYDTHVHGIDYYCVLWDFDQWLRAKIKYEDQEQISVQEVRDKLYEFLNEKDVSL
jgi:hypothetical protein